MLTQLAASPYIFFIFFIWLILSVRRCCKSFVCIALSTISNDVTSRHWFSFSLCLRCIVAGSRGMTSVILIVLFQTATHWGLQCGVFLRKECPVCTRRGSTLHTGGWVPHYVYLSVCLQQARFVRVVEFTSPSSVSELSHGTVLLFICVRLLIDSQYVSTCVN